MSQTKKAAFTKTAYHPAAYEFVDHALHFTQKKLGKHSEVRQEPPSDESHISGPQLLDGIRELALKEFGMMTIPVFRHWGITSTDDFGHIVFDMIDRERMRKTDRDKLSDFFGVYEFEEAFDRAYQIDTASAFRR
jgi:uncharacterized repeat protein (TIGR04138 family)